MKLRWKVTIGLVVVGIATAVTLSRRESSEQRALERTQRDLRAQGFKIDVTEFDFSTTDEHRARITALTNAALNTLARNNEEAGRRLLLQQVMPELMQTIGSDSAVPFWKQKVWVADATAYPRFGELPGDVWPALREGFGADRALLDTACISILGGPIRVPLNASHGHAMLLPHLAAWKNLSQLLGGRAALGLHDDNLTGAWTNLLGSTRLVTAWETEPVEISQLVRVACCAIAFNITWQALQTNGWSDEQLSQLQHEWESIDFFKTLPETAAFGRACAAGSIQEERRQTMADLGPTLKECVRSPRYAWGNVTSWYQRLRYSRHGSYEDEQKILLYYRDRELQLRQAAKAHTWSEMRQIPDATNTPPFQSKSPSGTLAMLNMKQLSMSWQMYSAEGQGRTLPARAADAETRRRLLVTAIALERFHGKRKEYPKSLTQLSPEFLKAPLVDFIDGKPLRYRLTDDGHFVLYSVGLDGVDNGGEARRSRQRRMRPDEDGVRQPREWDLVWPRPASGADVEAFQREQIRVMAEQKQREEEQQAELQWSLTAEKQLRAGKILGANGSRTSTEPKYRGRPLVEILGNKSVLGTNAVKITELLTLKQVSTGAEPEALTFDVPVNYDVLTNLGQLALLVDRTDSFEDSQGCWVECGRATNGNCILTWNTIYESPGLHALQLAFACSDPTSDEELPLVIGPTAAFTVSNLCQFSSSSAYFQPELGATFRAKLPEPNATYSLDITSPTGELLKTFTGSTSNGLMTVFWDLVDQEGVRRTNSSFNTLVQVKLQDSGRSQTLRGP